MKGPELIRTAIEEFLPLRELESARQPHHDDRDQIGGVGSRRTRR